MIDFHTHILPGIDDGSHSTEMTKEMLRREAQMGVTHIYATPHFYAHRSNIGRFLEKREKSFAKVRELLASDSSLPEVITGAEVYYFGGVGKAEMTPELCVDGTNILLLEMPFDQWTEEVYRDTERLVRERGLSVVLAHVERYTGFQKDKSVWERVMGLPVTIQMNAESFLKFGPKRHFCMNLLRQELGRVIIGSDCHNLTSRAPNLGQAMEYIEKKAGADTARSIEETEKKLLWQHM